MAETRQPSGQRILITGGTGFIGTALADRLCIDNEVVIFDRKLSGSSWTGSGHNGQGNVRVGFGGILPPHPLRLGVEGVDNTMRTVAVAGADAALVQPP